MKKILLKACIFIYIATLIIGLYVNYVKGNINDFFMTLLAVFTPLIIPALFYLLKLKITEEIMIINLVFVYFASLIGSGFNGYQIPFFDKVLHFTSGIFISMLAIIIYWIIKKDRRISDEKEHRIFMLFVLNTNLAIAMLWELYEYMMLVLFNNDCINHYTTGVHDSMTDMICALIAGLIVLYAVNRYYKHKKNNCLVNVCINFYDKNFSE